MNIEEAINTIKESRYHKKITQKKLALMAEVSERTIRRIEKGCLDVKFSTLVKVLAILGFRVKVKIELIT
jgi:predicted transcriptional regulator